MDFGKVLSRSWQIIWNNKVLWVFGILASCASRSGGGGSGSNFSNSFNSNGPTPNLPPQMERWFMDVQRFFERTPEDQIVLYGLLLVAAVLILVLITWLVGMYGKSALITGILQAESGRKLTFGQLWRDGWAPYGRILGLNTILGLGAFLVACVVAIPLLMFGAVTAGIGFLCVIPFLCLLIPLGIAFSVYTELANIAVVKEGLGATAALSRAWQLLRNNLGNLALMAIILIVGGFLFSLVLAIPLFIALAPLFAGMMGGAQSDLTQGFNIFLICLVVYIPVSLVLGGILQSYLQSAWTLTYGQIAGGSKVVTVSAPKKPAPRKTATRTTATRTRKS